MGDGEGPSPWPFSGVFFHSPISPPSLSLPPEVLPSSDLFFSYITSLKMALFKSVRHILRSEQGHMALLRTGHPPSFTTLFEEPRVTGRLA